MGFIGEDRLKELLTKIKNTFITSAQVDAKIAAAIGEAGSIQFESSGTLPATGSAGKIYLINHTGTDADDIFDEYIWYNNKWEHIGNTKVDLQNVITTSNIATSTTYGIVKPDNSTITVDSLGVISAVASDVQWSNVNNKPFQTLDTDSFDVNDGELSIKSTSIDSLNSIGDVNITSPTNNQILKYDATSSKWVNATNSSGGTGDGSGFDLSNVKIFSKYINASLSGSSTAIRTLYTYTNTNTFPVLFVPMNMYFKTNTGGGDGRINFYLDDTLVKTYNLATDTNVYIDGESCLIPVGGTLKLNTNWVGTHTNCNWSTNGYALIYGYDT